MSIDAQLQAAHIEELERQLKSAKESLRYSLDKRSELEAELKAINYPRGYVRNCLIHTGEMGETGALFYKEKGIVTCELDNYAIIPIEEYDGLKAELKSAKELLRNSQDKRKELEEENKALRADPVHKQYIRGEYYK